MKIKNIAFFCIIISVIIFISCGFVPTDENTFNKISYGIDDDLIYPGEDNVISDSTPLFFWSAYSDALSYDFQLCDEVSSDIVIIDEPGLIATQFQTVVPLSEDFFCWRYRINKSDGTVSPWFETVFSFFLFNDGFEINDGDFSTRFPWVLSGGSDPFVQSGVVYEGMYAAQFGSIGHGSKSSFEHTFTSDSDFTLNFHYSISSESYCDYLKFYADNQEELSSSGFVSWTLFSKAYTAGTYTFKWEYSKDSSVDTGQDTAWIDAISTVVF